MTGLGVGTKEEGKTGQQVRANSKRKHRRYSAWRIPAKNGSMPMKADNRYDRDDN
jgi:hypothetical protein